MQCLSQISVPHVLNDYAMGHNHRPTAPPRGHSARRWVKIRCFDPPPWGISCDGISAGCRGRRAYRLSTLVYGYVFVDVLAADYGVVEQVEQHGYYEPVAPTTSIMKMPDACSVYLPRPSTARLKMPPHISEVHNPQSIRKIALNGIDGVLSILGASSTFTFASS